MLVSRFPFRLVVAALLLCLPWQLLRSTEVVSAAATSSTGELSCRDIFRSYPDKIRSCEAESARDAQAKKIDDAKLKRLENVLKKAQLHVVSVYQGIADGKPPDPWWKPCVGKSNERSCLAATSTVPKIGAVSVFAHNTAAPLVLVLSSHDPVYWQLYRLGKANVALVIVTGLYPETIYGADTIPVIYWTQTPSCPTCGSYWPLSFDHPDSTEYIKGIEEMKNKIGLSPSSVQYQYSGKSFNVPALASSSTSSSSRSSSASVSNVSTSAVAVRLLSKDYGAVFSDSLTSASLAAGPQTTSYASRSVTSGKWYFEGKLRVRQGAPHPNAFTGIGVMPTGEVQFGLLENKDRDVMSVMDQWGIGVLKTDQVNDGDLVGIAVDLDNGVVYASRNGTWVLGNPVQGTGGQSIRTGRAYVGAVAVTSPDHRTAGASVDSWTVNFGAKPFSSTVPAGYAPYNLAQGDAGR